MLHGTNAIKRMGRLLALVLVLAMLPLPTFAAGEPEGTGAAAETVDCSELFTIQSVNEALQQTAATGAKVRIILGPHEYTAGPDQETVITIPDLTSCPDPDAITVCGSGAETVLRGSIRYEASGCGRIEQLTFSAPSQGSGTALSGPGAFSVSGCTFSGYAVAVLAESGRGRWDNNRFLNNGTAVRAEGLSEDTTPCDFRLQDSDFIGNTVDFDVSAAPGDYYFYRNFFGAAETSARSPVKKEGQNIRLHCYPARKHPITGGDATLILGSENTVLNDISGELPVSEIPSGTVIRVVSDPGSGAALLAVWTFGGGIDDGDVDRIPDPPAASGSGDGALSAAAGFDAGLTLTRTGGTMTVALPAANEPILQELRPTLTVFCPDSWGTAAVTLGGTPVQSSFAGHAASFTAAAAGVYTLTDPTYLPPSITSVNAASAAVSVTLDRPETGTVLYLASYAADGRMTELFAVTVEAGRTEYAFPLDGAGYSYVKAFLTDAAARPVCEAASSQ